MQKKCDECGTLFRFNKKDVKTQTVTRKNLVSSKNKCLKRGYCKGFINVTFVRPVIQETYFYEEYEFKEYYIICKCCDEYNFIKEEKLKFIKNHKETSIDYSYPDINGKYTDL